MKYLKCSCPHCANNVEYPSRLAGNLIECPHCQKQFSFPRPFPIKPLLLGTGSALAIIAVLAIVPRLKLSPETEAAAQLGVKVITPIVGLIFLLGIYFAPTMVALNRRHRNWPGIFILNLAFGWTIIGWVAALVWSVHRDRDLRPSAKTLLAILICTHCVQSFGANECDAYPYRTFDGTNFVDLSKTLPREWFQVAGWVTSVGTAGKDGSLLIRVDKGESTYGVAGGEFAHIIHLTNYPFAHAAIDGTYLNCYARFNGRHQYRTVQGATATVLSYDFGHPATPEQIRIINDGKRSNYLALVESAAIAKSNRTARTKETFSSNYTNYSIAPSRRPPP